MKYLLSFSISLFSVFTIAFSQPYIYSGPIDICYDKYDDAQDGSTEYLEQSAPPSNQNFNRLYKKTFINPGCDANPYKTVFLDDFDGDKLNTGTGRWRTHGSNSPPPLDLIRRCDNELTHLSLPQSVTVNGGFAHLKTEKLESVQTFECDDAETEEVGDLITVSRKFSCGRIESNALPASIQGCFRFGKFTVRAKIPQNNDNSVGAYWFFGWAGEVDVVEVCQPDCDGTVQSNRHLWIENPAFSFTQTCDNKSDNMDYPKDHSVNNIYSFHSYTFEWTPFKLVFTIDGVEKRKFYRFYKLQGLSATPLECEDLPVNQAVTVWEHIGWYSLFNHGMDLILSTDVRDEEGNAGGEMLVDWVKIEQRTSGSVAGTAQGADPDFICVGEQETYKVEGGIPLDSIIGWTVSPNLEIVSMSPLKDMVTVTPKSSANSYPGPGWVEINTKNWPSSCFGHNIKKHVWVGNPATPIVSAYKTCNFISLNIDNYSSDNTYLWEVLTPGFPSSVFNNGKNLNITVSPPTQQPVPIAYRLTAINPCGNTIITTVVFTLPCNKWQINVFPNPGNEVVNMGLVNFTQDELNENLTLYLIDGNFNIKKSMPVTQFTESMEVFDVEPGNHYIFTIVNGENVISSQFIIQH